MLREISPHSKSTSPPPSRRMAPTARGVTPSGARACAVPEVLAQNAPHKIANGALREEGTSWHYIKSSDSKEKEEFIYTDWFDEWEDGFERLWNAKLPEGLSILKCLDVEGPSLAKLASAAVYVVTGSDFCLPYEAKAILDEEVKGAGILYKSSFENGAVCLTIGDLEHCGAGNFVRALTDKGICGGWPDLKIVRETVGIWDAGELRVMPLI